MKTISLTVPMDYNALTRASDMLHGLAIDLSKEKPAPVVTGPGASSTAVDDQPIAAPEEQPAATIEQITEAEVNAGNLAPAATEVFAPKSAETATTAAAPVAAQPAETTPAPAPTAEAPATAQSATEQVAPTGVELDSDGLPWDHRIHALGTGGAHNKLKKTQQWKKKRGVDAALVAEVEAELRAAMSAGPANPVVTTVEPSPAPASPASPAAAPTTAAAAAQPASPAPAPAPAGGTTTFPALMAAITANGIDQAAVTAAVNAQGLQSLPLLAARPDLIPAVAAALGV